MHVCSGRLGSGEIGFLFLLLFLVNGLTYGILPAVWNGPVHEGETDDTGQKRAGDYFRKSSRCQNGMEFRTQVKEVALEGAALSLPPVQNQDPEYG